MYLPSFSPLFAATILATQTLSSSLALTTRDSSEALGNVQYLSNSWQNYITTLTNISRTYHIPSINRGNTNLPHYNTSSLPLDTQYSIIAVESTYNINFEYEFYTIDRIKAGPILSPSDSLAVINALKVLLGLLRPLFKAFGVFEDVIGKANFGYLLGESDQGQISLLIDAIASVVAAGQKDEVVQLGKEHDAIVASLRADFGVPDVPANQYPS